MTECPICLEHCDKEYCLVCGHFFHKNCLQRWLYQRNTCPVCRQPSTHIIQFHPIRNITRSLNTITSVPRHFVATPPPRPNPIVRFGTGRRIPRVRPRTTNYHRHSISLDRLPNNIARESVSSVQQTPNFSREVGEFRREEYSRIYASSVLLI